MAAEVRLEVSSVCNCFLFSKAWSFHFFMLLVVAIDSELVIYPKGPIQVREGQVVALLCQVKSTDAPFRMRWEYSDTLKSSNRVAEQQHGTFNKSLVIQNFQLTDSGTFKCTIINSMYEHKSRSVKINVFSAANGGCGSTRFRCHTGHCIFVIFRCNNIKECPDGSDEIGCDPLCTNGFLCDNGKCIDLDLVCDKFHANNCGDWSDERCMDGNHVSTPPPHLYKTVDTSYIIMTGILATLLIFVVLVIAICRVRLRRAAQRPIHTIRHRNDSSGSHDRQPSMLLNQRTHEGTRQRNDSVRSQEYRMSSSSSEFRHTHPRALPVPIIPNTVLTINSDMPLLSNNDTSYLPSPPPYSEIKEENEAPPPYSSVERLHQNSIDSERAPADGTCVSETATQEVPSPLSLEQRLRSHDHRLRIHDQRMEVHDQVGRSCDPELEEETTESDLLLNRNQHVDDECTNVRQSASGDVGVGVDEGTNVEPES